MQEVKLPQLFRDLMQAEAPAFSQSSLPTDFSPHSLDFRLHWGGEASMIQSRLPEVSGHACTRSIPFWWIAGIQLQNTSRAFGCERTPFLPVAAPYQWYFAPLKMTGWPPSRSIMTYMICGQSSVRRCTPLLLYFTTRAGFRQPVVAQPGLILTVGSSISRCVRYAP